MLFPIRALCNQAVAEQLRVPDCLGVGLCDEVAWLMYALDGVVGWGWWVGWGFGVEQPGR